MRIFVIASQLALKVIEMKWIWSSAQLEGMNAWRYQQLRFQIFLNRFCHLARADLFENDSILKLWLTVKLDFCFWWSWMPPITWIDWSCDHPCKCWYNTLHFVHFPAFLGIRGYPVHKVLIRCDMRLLWMSKTHYVCSGGDPHGPLRRTVEWKHAALILPTAAWKTMPQTPLFIALSKGIGVRGEVLHAVERDAVKR